MRAPFLPGQGFRGGGGGGVAKPFDKDIVVDSPQEQEVTREPGPQPSLHFMAPSCQTVASHHNHGPDTVQPTRLLPAPPVTYMCG